MRVMVHSNLAAAAALVLWLFVACSAPAPLAPLDEKPRGDARARPTDAAEDVVATPHDALVAPVDAPHQVDAHPDSADAVDGPSEAAADASAVDASPCPAGWGECSPGACINLAVAREHCGACGRACPAHASCSRGACVSPSGLTCPLDNADCDGVEATGCETQLRGDHRNCGACGNDCTARGLWCRDRRCAP